MFSLIPSEVVVNKSLTFCSMPRGSFTFLKAVERILTLSLETPPAEVASVRIVPIEERVDLAVDTLVSIESKETAA